MSEWQPIETAPKDGTTLLLAINREVVVSQWDAEPFCSHDNPYWLDMSGCCPTYECFRTYDEEEFPEGEVITHWMPLPEPPNGD